MSGFETTNGRLDDARLGAALLELEAGTIDPLERDELMAVIARSPAAQRAYLEYFEMTAMIEAEAEAHAESGCLPVVAGFMPPARLFRRSLLMAAALVVLGAAVAMLIKVAQPRVSELALTAAATSRWSVDGEAVGSDRQRATLREGETVRVESGTLELRLESGAAMVMQGPAEVSFPKTTRPVVRSGWLWVDTGKSGGSFEVETPELLVRDIGTRFGVRVPEGGPAEVHLIEGEAEVFAKSTGQKFMVMEPEERGFTIAATGELTGVELARDPFPELAGLLAAPGNYPTTVRSQNPAGYWRMEEAEVGELVNEVPQGLVGRRDAKVRMHEPGPGPADGFAGFAGGNPSVLLPGRPRGVPLSLGSTPVHNGILFRDDFSGDGADLHGATPDVTTNDAKWVAAPVFNRDGSIDPSEGSATLAFRPVDGVVYTLDASMATGAGPGEDWVALGFARGQSADKRREARFVGGAVVGRAWMLHRAADSTYPVNRAWLSTDGADWVWPGSPPIGGRMDLRIVLDTTGGPGRWTATWYAKRPADESYTTVRETAPLINESITSVGFAVSGDGISGTIGSFSLRADRSASAAPGADLAKAPARVARKEGAVSFWIRREAAGERREILVSAGEAPADDSIHVHLDAGGRAGFFMENGRYDVLLTSEEAVADGRWHHLAASWSPSGVELYLDGRRVAQDTEYRGMQEGILPELRFGSGPTGSGPAPFTGWVDEIAVWDRALTYAEVVHQFRSARGRQGY